MHERKKKGGERKDKNTKAMRDAIQHRREAEGEPRPHTDQEDIQTFKSGSAGDDSRHRPYPPK